LPTGSASTHASAGWAYQSSSGPESARAAVAAKATMQATTIGSLLDMAALSLVDGIG
jgi:hypothetical protein